MCSVNVLRLEFYEEITPLVVAAEYGACDVIKDRSSRDVLRDSMSRCCLIIPTST